MNLLRRLVAKVTYTCNRCAARQRIPLRRIHFFERFHDLKAGEPVPIVCPHCEDGVHCPSPYLTHAGHPVTVDPPQKTPSCVASTDPHL
jgi:hypothetical protein